MIGSSDMEEKVLKGEPVVHVTNDTNKIIQDPDIKALSLEPSSVPETQSIEIVTSVTSNFTSSQGESTVSLLKIETHFWPF